MGPRPNIPNGCRGGGMLLPYVPGARLLEKFNAFILLTIGSSLELEGVFPSLLLLLLELNVRIKFDCLGG